LNTDIRKFESSQKDESRAQSADSSNAYRKPSLELLNVNDDAVNFKTEPNMSIRSVVPKLGVNYPPGVKCDSSVGNAEPKPHCCSVLWAITAKYWGN